MLRIVRVILHGLIVVGLSSESFQLSSKDSPNIRKVENVTSILGFTGDLSLPSIVIFPRILMGKSIIVTLTPYTFIC